MNKEFSVIDLDVHFYLNEEQKHQMDAIVLAKCQLQLFEALRHMAPDFDYASPILDFSIFRGQNRHFCPRLVSFEHQTKA